MPPTADAAGDVACRGLSAQQATAGYMFGYRVSGSEGRDRFIQPSFDRAACGVSGFGFRVKETLPPEVTFMRFDSLRCCTQTSSSSLLLSSLELSDGKFYEP